MAYNDPRLVESLTQEPRSNGCATKTVPRPCSLLPSAGIHVNLLGILVMILFVLENSPQR